MRSQDSSSEMSVGVKNEALMRSHEITYVSRFVGGYSNKVTTPFRMKWMSVEVKNDSQALMISLLLSSTRR